MAVYYATKAYVLSFSLALSEELRGTGVTVTVLCPGPTETNFGKTANVGSSRMFTDPVVPVMHPAAVARRGYAALRRGELVVVPGLTNLAVAAMSRIVPYELVLPVSRWVVAARQPRPQNAR
jgi:short-subunit dehydrogenase